MNISPKFWNLAGIVLVARPQRVFVELDALFRDAAEDRAAQPAVAERIHPSPHRCWKYLIGFGVFGANDHRLSPTK